MNQLMTLFIFLFSISANAQITIQKDIDINSSNKIDIDLPYAKTIKLETWSEKHIHIKAEISIEEGKYDKEFSLNIKRAAKKISIASNYGSLFKKNNKFFNFFSNTDNSTTIKLGKSKNQDYVVIDDKRVKATYIILFPESLDVDLSSNSGDLDISSFYGNLSTNITSGDITVKVYQGDLNITTVSGSIDIQIAEKSRLKAKTVLGKIQKENSISELIIGEKTVGSFAQRNVQGASHTTRLSTTTGNIILRK